MSDKSTKYMSETSRLMILQQILPKNHFLYCKAKYNEPEDTTEDIYILKKYFQDEECAACDDYEWEIYRYSRGTRISVCKYLKLNLACLHLIGAISTTDIEECQLIQKYNLKCAEKLGLRRKPTAKKSKKPAYSIPTVAISVREAFKNSSRDSKSPINVIDAAGLSLKSLHPIDHTPTHVELLETIIPHSSNPKNPSVRTAARSKNAMSTGKAEQKKTHKYSGTNISKKRDD